ncbi:MAG: malto-oligosyltrehalose trehalohydrolase [Tepidisphaerales bacterium]
MWKASLGAWPEKHGATFRVWAPRARKLEVVLDGPASGGSGHPLEKSGDGTFGGWIPGVRPGDRYRYRVNGKGPFPDPASRFQPAGVHGPSEIIDPSSFAWTDHNWTGVGPNPGGPCSCTAGSGRPRETAAENCGPPGNVVKLCPGSQSIYELHVGTFTPQGTFAGVTARLPRLVELGVTAIELMPLADFPGQRNWGYDGVSLFAPARCYGRPDDLRRLVDTAHRLGLAVLLDVVYNHVGPDGSYLGAFSPHYFAAGKHTPWGAALNFDGRHSKMVRRFFIENALHWLHEYHFDGLRLDAIHAIADSGSRPFVAELAATARASLPQRRLLFIAEDYRNLSHLLEPASAKGWDLDGVWADDFHHQMHRLLTGDNEADSRSYTGSLHDLATTMRRGWFFCGQKPVHRTDPRGTDPSGLSMAHFVWCLQNHDQVGNRPLGDRLHRRITHAACRAAAALLLCSPATPLLFMGEEWAASTPFLFFTDHNPELGAKVTAGRRREFRRFSAFADPGARERIPDPQSPATFHSCVLNWHERDHQPHLSMFRLYRALLHLRRTDPALQSDRRDDFEVAAIDGAIVLLRRAAPPEPALLVIACLATPGVVDLRRHPVWARARHRQWQIVLTTEDRVYSPAPHPPHVDLSGPAPVLRFTSPAAVVLREHHPA